MADPTAGQISLAELEVTWGHTGDLSWAELEVTWGHTGDLSWAELQTPLVATAGQVSFSEIVFTVDTAGQVSFVELEVPHTPTAGQIAWTEIVTPLVATAGQASQAWFEIAQKGTAGRISWARVDLGDVPVAGVISQAYLAMPKSYAASFVTSNGTVDIFQSANLSAIQSAGQIAKVGITSSGVYYSEPEDIEIVAEHSTNPSSTDDAVLEAVIGAVTTKTGTYRTTKGFLSADKFLQDPDYYNDHTYVVRVAESFDRWERIFKKTLHPAGFKLIGEFVAVMTPAPFSMTAEDAIVDESV